MIIGITLGYFAKLQKQGDKIKSPFWVQKLLDKKSTKTFKTNDIQYLSMAKFVDCERYLEEMNFKEFCRIFVNKRFWQTVYVHNLELIILDYAKQKEKLFEQNYYIYNPPQYGESGSETIGSDLRKDFVDEFGNYVVLMDKVQGWDKTGYKLIEQWKVKDFFFWANYLTGQQIIENIK